MTDNQATLPVDGIDKKYDSEAILNHLEEDEIKDKWPKVLTEYVDVVTSDLLRKGKSENEAKETAYSVVMALAKYRGGKIEYLPTGKNLETALKHKAMWDMYNGRNIPEVAARFKMNEISVYEIIKKQRALNVKKRGGLLPLEMPEV